VLLWAFRSSSRRRGEIGPIRVITHRLPPAEAPHGYELGPYAGAA
jgi:hypothetical protein